MKRRTAVLLTAAGLVASPFSRARAADAFDALVTAAKAEGSLVVDGPPIDAVRQALATDFTKKYGIPVTYITSGGGGSGARVRAERAAGKYLLDVFISGSDTPLLTFLPSGWLDRIEPILIEPDSVNPKDWRDGHLWYADPQHTILRMVLYQSVELGVNAKLVSPKQIPTWHSLLEPKWKGKLLVKDPTTSGAGQSLTSYFYINFGPDFVRALYKDQQPVFESNPRQAAQWLADGTYAIWIGADFGQLNAFVAAGYNIQPVYPTDGPGILTSSFGLVCLMNRAAHPNAAKLFVNWIASREGELSFARALTAQSLRTDIKQDWVPSYQTLRPGKKYYDAYDYNFVTSERDKALAKVRELLGY